MDFEDYAGFLREVMPVLPLYAGALLGAAVVQWVRRHYKRLHERYGRGIAACGLSGELVAQRLLAASGLADVRVVRQGSRDLYHPWKREIRLSATTFNNLSIAALATAAHEVGHAQQFAAGILLCRLRRIVWPICWVLAGLAVLLPLASFVRAAPLPFPNSCVALITITISTLVLQLPIHLPLERDASIRARKLVQETGLITAAEQAGFDKLLTGAWLTYAAAEVQRWVMVFGVASLLWFSPSFFETSGFDFANAEVSVDPRSSYASSVLGIGADDPNFARAGAGASLDPAAEFEPEPTEDEVQMLLDAAWEDPVRLPPPWDAETVAQYVDSLPIALFDSLLYPIAMLAVMVPFCFFVGRFLKGYQPRRTATDHAIAKSNAGMTLHEQGAFANAIAEFDEALRIDPTLATAHYNRGHSYLMLGRLDEAMADLDAALRLEPGLIHAMVARGDVWVKRGNPERALAEYEAAHRMAPQNAVVLTCRGYAWIMRTEYERAFADFELALRFNPKDPLASAGRAIVWLSLGDLNRAQEDCDRAISLGGGDSIVFATRGRLFLAKNDIDRAIADLTKALMSNPKDATVLRDRGLAWFYKADFARALTDLNESIRIDPTDAVSFNNRGAALLKTGDYAQAASDLNESIRLNLNFPNPLKNLSWLEATCPDESFRSGPNALAHALRALELTEWKPVEWFSILAAAHAEAGNFEEAVDWLSKCIAQSPPHEHAEWKRQLGLYQARRPFREQPATPVLANAKA
jgi:tetratricopeptide (TPR) repeat protein/Zn-dependent membrane protease YugP